MPNDYTWMTYKQNQVKFTKLRSGKGSYDSLYFGLYASHTEATDNTETYQDDRSNIFKSTSFKVYLHVFAGIFVFAVYYLFNFFNGDVPVVEEPTEVKVHESELTKHPDPEPVKPVKKTAIKEDQQTPPERSNIAVLRDDYAEHNYIERIASSYRPRLAAYIFNDKKQVAIIEFLDDSFHAKEVLTLQQLMAFGWQYEVKDYGLLIFKNTTQFVVTAWPLDVYGKVSQRTSESL